MLVSQGWRDPVAPPAISRTSIRPCSAPDDMRFEAFILLVAVVVAFAAPARSRTFVDRSKCETKRSNRPFQSLAIPRPFPASHPPHILPLFLCCILTFPFY